MIRSTSCVVLPAAHRPPGDLIVQLAEQIHAVAPAAYVKPRSAEMARHLLLGEMVQVADGLPDHKQAGISTLCLVAPA